MGKSRPPLFHTKRGGHPPCISIATDQTPQLRPSPGAFLSFTQSKRERDATLSKTHTCWWLEPEASLKFPEAKQSPPFNCYIEREDPGAKGKPIRVIRSPRLAPPLLSIFCSLLVLGPATSRESNGSLLNHCKLATSALRIVLKPFSFSTHLWSLGSTTRCSLPLVKITCPFPAGGPAPICVSASRAQKRRLLLRPNPISEACSNLLSTAAGGFSRVCRFLGLPRLESPQNKDCAGP